MALSWDEKTLPTGQFQADRIYGLARRYTRTIQVTDSAGTVGPNGIATYVSGAVATVGAQYAWGSENDLSSYLQSITPAPLDGDAGDGEKVWIVTLEYGPYDPSQKPEDPTEEEPQVDFDAVQFARIFDKDRDDKPVLNSAGDPFDPAPEMDDSRPVLRVVRNEATFSLALAYEYRDKVNDDTWLGAPAGTVKAAPVKATRKKHPAIGWYFVIEYMFEFNPDGWTKKIVDLGMQELDGTNRKLIKDSKGEIVSNPVPLDGSGVKLANPSPANAVILSFEPYDAIDFSASFGLDTVLGPVFV